MMICGVDEAGRGPVIGPLVVCGVRIEDDAVLKKAGVRDSKRLTRGQREQLFEKIGALADQIQVVEISAGEIDLLREEMTLNELEAKIFASVIEKLHPSVAYVDSADTDELRFGEHINQELESPVEIISKHGADDLFPVVSAASIVAKIRRDAAVKRIEDELGEPIGSGYPSDPMTIRFLESWLDRYGDLPPNSRRSWDTCSRLIKMRSVRRIDEF